MVKKSTKTISKSTPKRSRPRRVHPKTGEVLYESDSVYFLKLVIYFLLGTFWIKFEQPLELGGIVINALPVGFLIGLLLVRILERHQTDRKIWYVVLLVITLISYFENAGIVI